VDEPADLAAEIVRLRERVAEAEARAAQAERERAELATALEQLRGKLADTRAHAGEAAARLVRIQRQLADVTAQSGRIQSQVRARPEPAAAPSKPVEAPRATAPGETTSKEPPVPEIIPRLVVVVDDGPGWQDATLAEHELAVAAPGADLAARLAELGPARLVVNLAMPGALAALAALRAGGCTSRAWGCIANQATRQALPLGVIEPAARPLDADAILAALGPAARRMRVVAVGAEVEARVSLRQTLSRRGMSVSMAWDAKQAVDLFTMVKPDLIILDLALPHDGHAIVASLAALDPVPHAVLLPGTDDAEEFVRLLAEPAHVSQLLSFDECLARMLAPRAPAAGARS
jgi:CheY-like chemotaxis protein